MKTLVTILFAIITVVTYSQNELCKYKIHSKIWRDSIVIENGKKVVNKLPIKCKSFSLKTSYVEQNINEREIEKYLLVAFDEFRKDYNEGPVTEVASITKGADEYSVKMSKTGVQHDVNLPYGQSECVSMMSFMMFSKITKEDGDINKIIADSYFDIFAGSEAHMNILLDKRTPKFGFGITIVNGMISIVVRGTK